MDTSLRGRRALVTGAASGIGREIAEAFAREGATVAVHARSAERAEPTVEAIRESGGRAIAAPADLRDRGALVAMCREAIGALGGLDILVNNAGVFHIRTLDGLDEGSWDAIIETNLTAPYLMTRAARDALRSSGPGASITFVSSIAANAHSAGWSAYAASKNGLDAFMHCMADEFGEVGVRVNAIAPGWVETKMAEDAHRYTAARDGREFSDHFRTNMRANMLGALLPPDTIADMAVFLASDRGRFITAQTMTVCGGCVPGSRADAPPTND